MMRGGVMVLVARFGTISNQIVPETRITPKLKVGSISAISVLLSSNPAEE
jgi:hypothetical protein